MQETQKIAQLKILAKKRNALMQKVHLLDSKINALLSSKTLGKQGTVPTGKHPCPKEGSGPYQLCQAMGSKPMTLEQIANKTGLTLQGNEDAEGRKLPHLSYLQAQGRIWK
jgi:hypothetical protein